MMLCCWPIRAVSYRPRTRRFIDAALSLHPPPCRSWAVGTGGSIFREPSLGTAGIDRHSANTNGQGTCNTRLDTTIGP